MHARELELLQGIFLSRTAAPPLSEKSPKASASVLVGFDTEWAGSGTARRLLTVQFALKLPDGRLVSEVYLPPGAKLTPKTLAHYVACFVKANNVVPKKVRGAFIVDLISHSASAEIGMFDDPLKDLEIFQINKVHHANVPRQTLDDGSVWELHIDDLFAYFPTSLKKIGAFIGLPKLETDPTKLEQLMMERKDEYRAYAARDAEIAVEAMHRFRAQLLAEWQVDILKRPTLAAVAGEIFRRRFFKNAPMPFKYEVENGKRKLKSGEWVDRQRRVVRFCGNEKVRLAACRAAHGGRVEAYAVGFIPMHVEEFDARSLYPSSSLLQPLPNDKTRWVEVTGLDQVAALEGFGLFKFAFPSSTKYPCLPVIRENKDRLLFPLTGLSHCTFAEARAALKLGAEVKVVGGWGFVPGEPERNHDLVQYMKAILAAKSKAEKGSLEYETNKLLLNSLVGKLMGKHKSTNLLALERELRQRGLPAGAAGAVARLHGLQVEYGVDGLWAPEWNSLILGKARALMAEFVAKGALLVSTDSVIVPTGTDLSCSALEELKSVESDMTHERTGDATFIVRSRMYAVMKRTANLTDAEKPLAKNSLWAVMKVARHGAQESPSEFAETILNCLAAGQDVAAPRTRQRRVSAETAAREGLLVNDDLVVTGKTKFSPDKKRCRLDRDVNIFKGWTWTKPYISLEKLEASERLSRLRSGTGRKKYRKLAPELEHAALDLLSQGLSYREVEKKTGVPRSTLSDLKRKAAASSPGGSPTKSENG